MFVVILIRFSNDYLKRSDVLSTLIGIFSSLKKAKQCVRQTMIDCILKHSNGLDASDSAIYFNLNELSDEELGTYYDENREFNWKIEIIEGCLDEKEDDETSSENPNTEQNSPINQINQIDEIGPVSLDSALPTSRSDDYERHLNGDSEPFPFVTKEDLDKEMDQYWAKN
jgi:hypothetical protein